MARPTIYTQEIADLICERLAGGESLRTICKDESLPARRTVVGWRNTNAEFMRQYARARDDQAELYADEIVDICDETMADNEHVALARLRVDNRKWILSKLKPGTYGDKVQHANAAGDGNVAVVFRWADAPAEQDESK